MTPRDSSARIAGFCAMAPVIPVLVVEDPALARPLAQALVAGGLPVLEVTLRTPRALEAIAAMADVPGAVVGAGTLIAPADVQAARAAGARFGVSPGATEALCDAALAEGLPFLPGAATASEVMRLMTMGYAVQKFFPAVPAGGSAALRALAGPLPGVRFCPTGGIGPDTAADFLRLDNVACVGGSWVAPPGLQADHAWDEIAARASAAAALRPPAR